MAGARTLSAVITTSLLLLIASGASAQLRDEVLRWTHPDASEVSGFRLYWGTASGVYTDLVDLTGPSVVGGAFQHVITVSPTAELFFAVTAYNSEAESPFSNEICRGPNGACGAPPPDDPPAGAVASITGFRLWDAATDTQVDGSFGTGEQISLAAHSCVAIEIVGNAYLASGAGSVRAVYDGQGNGTCSAPGATRFAWETTTNGGDFGCAASLTVPGSHTLTVTPYENTNCSGGAGTPVALQFEVVEPEDGGGTGDPLAPGQPGQPFLILE